MPPIIRKATPDDAALLMRVIDIASEGFLPRIWEAMAPDGIDGSAVGLATVNAKDGEFSYRHGFVLEEGGTALGGMIGYPLPSKPEPVGYEVPAAFAGVNELQTLVPGYWYINVLAVEPEARRHGLGTALLNEAEVQAQNSDCPGMALIVVATNTGAIGAYTQAGYREKARRPFDLSEFGEESTEALLMVKGIC